MKFLGIIFHKYLRVTVIFNSFVVLKALHEETCLCVTALATSNITLKREERSMKRIQFILPVLFTMALGFVILSCDNKEVVTSGVPGGIEERYYDLDYIIGKKWCTTTPEASGSKVKRAYYFNRDNKGVVCDWNDGNWEGYNFTYSLDTASNTVNIESDTYSSEKITLKVIQIKSERFFGPTIMEVAEQMGGSTQRFTLELKTFEYTDVVSNYIENNSPVHPKVLADPQKYGFESRKVMMLLSNRINNKNNELKQIKIWDNGDGFFIKGGDLTDNIFREWYIRGYEQFDYAPGGVLRITPGMRHNMEAKTARYFQIVVDAEEVEIDNIQFSDFSPYKHSYKGSSYDSNLGTYWSGCFDLFAYYDDFSWSDVVINVDVPWLRITHKRIIYNKDEASKNDPQYIHNCTYCQLYFAETENTGYQRTGHIDVYVTAPQGKVYHRTITVIQEGQMSGGDSGTGGSGGGTGNGDSKCSICNGTGRCTGTYCYKGTCSRCGGTGMGTMGKKCNYCNNGECRTCGGTGKCKYCGGSGKI